MKLNVSYRYTFKGSAQELAKEIQTIEDPMVESLGNGEYILHPNASVGVSLHGGMATFGGIKVYADTHAKETHLQIVHLKTHTRVEQIIIAIAGAIGFIVSLFQGLPIWVYFLIPAIWVALHMVFHLVYRTQENAIISRFQGLLSLEKEIDQGA